MERSHRGFPGLPSGRTAALLATLVLSLAAPGLAAPTEAAAPLPQQGSETAESADDYLVVDCLLPGKVRRLGRRQTYVTRRRPIRTTALDCRIRGGEYTAYDRADYASALAVWMTEASAGSVEAQYNIGQIYEKGLGTEPDYESAALWYRRAAEQGHAASQTSLGYLYEQGLGVEKDPVEALNWYRKAAGLPDEFVLLESSEYEELEGLRQELETKQEEIESLERRLQETQEELRQEEEADRADREEEEQLQAAVEGLRGELEARRRSAARSQERIAQLQEQIDSLAAAGEAGAAAAGLELGPYHALVIGNRTYQRLPELASAADDARAVAALLKEKYGFEVRLLLDATRVDIMTALNDLREQLTEADNLLIFYAGRSESDIASQRGWWQPVDADPVSRVNWISNRVLSDHLELIPAQHALVVADASYQGTLTRSSIPRLPRGMTPERRREYIEKMAEKRARLVLASGESQPVPGAQHSVFSGALLDILAENRDVLAASSIYRELTRRLARSSSSAVAEFAPMRWADHEGGSDFFLVPSAR